MGGYADEFPLLSALGLYAADIRGDGNCLFNSLSDQIYGSQDQHPDIRAKVIEYMREHGAYYKMFLDVHPGGGTRRNPKRKTTGAYTSPQTFEPPTQEDIDRVFEQHLQVMAQGGTWGDNMEIQAFSSAYDIDVKIYQRDFAFMIQASQDGQSRPVAHIAYHTWEHYSSIRNLDGPHTGPPDVKLKPLSPEEEHKQKERLRETPVIQSWMINALQNSLPYLIDKQYAKKILEECNGNMNDAVSKLLDSEDGASASSAQESSSIEREPDSDDDFLHAPNKKQNRRASRAPRHKVTSTQESSRLAVLQPTSDNDASQESTASFDSDAPSSVDASQHNSQQTTPLTDPDTAASKTNSPTKTQDPAKRPFRIKINPPKPPVDSSAPEKSDSQPQSQAGAKRISAREKKDMAKRAQKAARKARQQETMKGGMALRSKGLTETPPIEPGFRTLFI
ncbi:cysteine proteinase [Myriangium duriaei CBS 260.36]|uniref:Cysteine proteinase n=1 Tax=Myriangium duriaei CBS 260.36 TaxID=1168546 RepID=A0A9P4IY70_9PEZI|nr:cysteine proteinase [Myriangium duriaei CBS 260.36]